MFLAQNQCSKLACFENRAAIKSNTLNLESDYTIVFAAKFDLGTLLFHKQDD